MSISHEESLLLMLISVVLLSSITLATILFIKYELSDNDEDFAELEEEQLELDRIKAEQDSNSLNK
ncbi:hypothetical protein [Poseidonibacter ostreae]|uniref:Uncharacterized protein n=1 Tax=Poseidonibacter ostreae TaxID=2654171 RepID=A0A6L4WYA1_9BACT|nr:hypothetical protein [Poseidonibacter ostreae]KAB7891450.1 hypothetical protein GBG19_01015 [Poseidonibacter ostreae]